MLQSSRPTALDMKPRGPGKKVDTAEWAAPVVPVVKPTGAIRLCGDYKVSTFRSKQVPLTPPRGNFYGFKWR